MSYYKKITIYFLSFYFILYFSIGSLFYIQYAQPYKTLFNITQIFNPFLEILHNKGFSKLYYFNPKVFSNAKSTFTLDFSSNDIKYKDSIIKLIKNGNVNILEDRYKNWRNFKVIENENGVNSKFKFHGSSTTPYRLGYESFTIKSKYPINGYKKFKLITGNEMGYFNIFLNHISKKFSLISEDTGDIVATNSLGEIRDFYQYAVFDEEYLKSNYGIINSTILRRNTFFDATNPGQWHSSDLDKVPYNLDMDMINKNDYIFWKNFNQNPNNSQFDPKYMGSFFALLQLFGHPHQITGNNDKWLISENLIYPIYRNEGKIIPISVLDIQKNLIFEKYYYSSSLDTYKKMLVNEDVIINRSLAFKKIVDNKHVIIKDLDSIYSSYKGIHQKYNKDFLKLKYRYSLIRRILIDNINSIEQYLNTGFTILYFDGNELKIKSTRNNKLQVQINEKIIDFSPILFNYNQKNKTLELDNNELLLNDISDISDLKIIDKILNKTLEIEKDYSILRSY